MRTVCLTAFLVLMLATPALADPDWKEAGQALGKPGSSCPAAFIASASRGSI